MLADIRRLLTNNCGVSSCGDVDFLVTPRYVSLYGWVSGTE